MHKRNKSQRDMTERADVEEKLAASTRASSGFLRSHRPLIAGAINDVIQGWLFLKGFPLRAVKLRARGRFLFGSQGDRGIYADFYR